jgi:hypothetical protein
MAGTVWIVTVDPSHSSPNYLQVIPFMHLSLKRGNTQQSSARQRADRERQTTAMAPGKSKKVASAGIRNSEADGVDLNEYWRVGPFLAKGAQASVHALLKKKESSKSTTNINSSGIRSRTGTDDDDQYYVDSEYVVKVAEMPDKLAPVKAKKSLMEINADSLNGEYMCYNNLRPLQGRLIPRLPPFAANARDLRTFPPITGVATVNGMCAESFPFTYVFHFALRFPEAFRFSSCLTRVVPYFSLNVGSMTFFRRQVQLSVLGPRADG